MTWEIPAISTPVNNRHDRYTTLIGVQNFESYYTLSCEWVGHYFDRLNPMNIYYDPFLYPDTEGINPAYVIDEAALESGLLSLTTGDSISTTDVWLWHTVTGNDLYGERPARHQDYPIGFTHLSTADIYSDWDLSTSHDIGNEAWATPDVARFIDIFKGNSYTGYRTLDNRGATQYQTPYGEFDLNQNSGNATVDFGGSPFGPNIVLIANPTFPNAYLYMNFELYSAFVNVRSLFELCGGDMTWLDTWDGTKAEANISSHYFGGAITVLASTVKPLFVGHPNYLPRYNSSGASPAGTYEFWKSSDDNWYLNGHPIFDKDTPADDLPFSTPNTADLAVVGQTLYSLSAMMRFDMAVVIEATKIPYYSDDLLGRSEIGRQLMDFLINGRSRPIIKTSHCLAGSNVEIHEYHDARIALADGGFTLDASSLIWTWSPYLAPQAWYSSEYWGNTGGLACTAGGKYIEGVNVYEATDIQNTNPPNADVNAPFNNGTTSGAVTVTYNWPAADAPYLDLNVWRSKRVTNISQSRTEDFIDPAGGQLPPNSPTSWETYTYSFVDNRVVISGATSSGTVEVHSVDSESRVLWERAITDHTIDIDGNKTFGPWTEVPNGEININRTEDVSNDAFDARDCTTIPHVVIFTDVEDRTFSSNGGTNVDISGHSINHSFTKYTHPPEPVWGILDHIYDSLDIANSTSIHDTDSSLNTSLVTNSVELRKTSDDSVTQSWAVSNPPFTDTDLDGNSTITLNAGIFFFDYAPISEPHYIMELRTFTDNGGPSPADLHRGSVGGGPNYSSEYPQAVSSTYLPDDSNRPPLMSISRIASVAPNLQSVEVVEDYRDFLRSHQTCIFDGRTSNRIHMGSTAEMLHPTTSASGPMQHVSGRSLRGNTIGLDTDSSGNTWITFEPVVAGIDEVFITLETGEVVRTMVIVTGLTHITDFGDNRGAEHWRSHDNKRNSLRSDYYLDSDAYDFFQEDSTTTTFRDVTPIKPTDEASVLTNWNQYPLWAANTAGYVEYTLTKNHLLSDGINIETSVLKSGELTLITTTSGKPFALSMVIIGTGQDADFAQVMDSAGALYCVDESNPVLWHIKTELITSSQIQFLYIDIESQEKRVTDVITVDYTPTT